MLEIFLTFLKLGAIGFGGPIALIALIEQEVCHSKRWLSIDQFAEIFSVCKLLPGPVAVQVAICCGYQRRGRLGGLCAGIAFLLPALVLVILLSSLYLHNLSTSSPQMKRLFEFMQDATLAIIMLTILDLGRVYIKNKASILIMLVCIALIYKYPGYEPLIILAFGFMGISVYKTKQRDLYHFPVLVTASMPQILTTINASIDVAYSKLIELFWICIKAGEFSFGTGLAIIPLLHADLVTANHWLTDKQFLDGITIGQVTPGPTTISIVFFGFISAGYSGLIISLLGFYIPPLFNSLIIIPLFWRKLTGSPYLRIFTMWAFPAVIGGIISATIKLSISAVKNYQDILLIMAALLVIRKKILPIWAVIPLYGIAGLVSSYFM